VGSCRVQTVPCPHCAEPVRPTATFCLACDQPIVDTERGLSVAEATPASLGRPLVGLAVGLTCLLLLGGAAYGGFRIYHHAHTSTIDQATREVRRGVTLIVSAEGGRGAACRELEPVVAPPGKKTLAECRAIEGDDRGAHVDAVSVGRPRFSGPTGTAQVRATVTDPRGRHQVDEQVRLVEVRRHWKLAWDGRPALHTT
jgi:hypothetical protein